MKHLFPMIAALSIAGGASAAIFPVPQTMSETGTAFATAGATFRLTGAENADPAAVALLQKQLSITPDGAIEIVIGQAATPAHEQGYELTTTPSQVTITGYDAAGTFYGAQSFLQLMADDEVPAANITDWPVNAVRGITEGFYGNPWSYDDRMDMMTNLMPHSKMNIYIYGPKNDPYHRANWAAEYPEEEGRELAEIAQAGRDNHVTFVWAMHPSNQITGDNLAKAVNKFEKMYDLGIRRFAIFFDDISANSVDDQITYLNHLNSEFVKKHSDVGSLIVCPTEYNRAWAGGTYLPKMGQGLDPDIEIMWTGGSVVDQKLGPASEWFFEQTGRKPFIWLNYPVNDYGYSFHPLLMSPYDPAVSNIHELTSGFTSNPMEFYEASKVALCGVGDFTWNPAAYNDWESWEQTLSYMMPGHEDAFRTYCYCNFYYPQPSHGVSIPYQETPDFKAIIDQYPAYTSEAATALNDFFAKQVAAGQELLSVSDSRLVAEIAEYLSTYTMQGQRGQVMARLRQALDTQAPADFIAAYTEYKELTDSTERCIARNYPGSIRTNRGNSGNQFVEPYIAGAVNEMVGEFQSAGYEYPEGLFPAQLIPTGKYIIKWNGRYLSNGNGKSAATASEPTFRATEDDVNADRQVWNIKYDANVDRYSITSEFDGRYVNEKGVFGTNVYNNTWNTYEIYGLNGKFAIKRGGKGGSDFWGVNSNKLKADAGADYKASLFIFELIPVGSDAVNDTVVPLEEDTEYLICDLQGRVLRRASSGNNLTFTQRPNNITAWYKFTFTANENGRYELRSARTDKAYVNEKGSIGTNQFYANWNTYRIFEKNGRFAIQNWEDAKEDYWFVDGDAIGRKAMKNAEAYVFILEKVETSGIDEILAEPSTSSVIYDLQGRRVANPGHGLYIINGKKIIL